MKWWKKVSQTNPDNTEVTDAPAGPDERSDYCEGLSINADLFWHPTRDVHFLTTAGSSYIPDLLNQAAQAGHMKIVDTKMTTYGDNQQFGFTYLVVLGQSHVILHTWPERHMMNIDIFTCGSEGSPVVIFNFIKGSLKPDQIRQNQYQRGIRKDIDNADEASASQVSATSA
jgi:S-adenosylmethionine/arginine decarboxylase-like enzyme